MGTLGNLFELIRDTSYEEIEEEANREVIIAVGGNSTDVRDKLNRALNTRLEGLWQTNPFRLVDTNERPKSQVDEEGGLFIYAIYKNDHIPTSKISWIKELAASQNVAVLIAVLPKREESFSIERRSTNRFQNVNPLRLVKGDRSGSEKSNTSLAAADGATFNSGNMETRPTWQAELEELREETSNKVKVVILDTLELSGLQLELLPAIVESLPGRELALARRAPVFRNTVANHLINAAARSNAETVFLANVTAGIPLLSGIFGGGADFILLTKNQFKLVNQLASVYGQKRDSRVEIFLELVPILAMAFVWRSLTRRSLKRIPIIAQVFPKAAIAYGASWATGRVAQAYYSSGRKAPRQLADFTRTVYERALSNFNGKKINTVKPEQGRKRGQA